MNVIKLSSNWLAHQLFHQFTSRFLQELVWFGSAFDYAELVTAIAIGIDDQQRAGLEVVLVAQPT